jgi:hypothetical protein
LDKFFVCDTEDNSKGSIYWIVFFDGKRYWSFDNQPAAIKFLYSLPKHTKIYCVNVEYDICNIFWGNLHLLKMTWGNRLIKVKFANVLFLDTLNQWQIGVEAMGLWLGDKKLPFNPQNLTYCKKDCLITYNFIKSMAQRYEREQIPLKTTIGQTAISLWKEKFWKKPIYKLSREFIEFLKPAYYGGRVECFHIGKITGNVHSADIKSMYPSRMMKLYPYPFKFSGSPDILKEGITYAKVFSDLALPVLPFRGDDGILSFPNGSFTGAWSNVELRYFISCGGVVRRIIDGITFNETCYPFREYVKFVWEKRQRAAGTDDFLDYLYKLLSNNLYGKFAQGNERTVIINELQFKGLKLSQIPDNFKEFQGLYILKQIGDYPFFSNYIWSIYTTAYARIYLHEILSHFSRKSKVLYCDTDSIYWQGKKDIFKFGSDLGDLNYEHEYEYMEIRGNKFYDVGGKIKCKGVPKKNMLEFFNKGYAEYQKPLRLKEAIRRNLQPNVWIDYTKKNKIIYNKRKVLPDGNTIPLIINA